jgi:chorismate mutase
LFKEFEENYDEYGQQDKANKLEKIRNEVINDAKKNEVSEDDINPYFCRIFDYYAVSQYSELYNSKC